MRRELLLCGILASILIVEGDPGVTAAVVGRVQPKFKITLDNDYAETNGNESVVETKIANEDWYEMVIAFEDFVADEAFADPNRLVIDPDPASVSGKTKRVIGWASSITMLVTVIVLPDEGVVWGVNAWPSNSTDQRPIPRGADRCRSVISSRAKLTRPNATRMLRSSQAARCPAATSPPRPPRCGSTSRSSTP